MTYGIELINEAGAHITDFGKVLSVRNSGTCRKASDLASEAQAASIAAGYGYPLVIDDSSEPAVGLGWYWTIYANDIVYTATHVATDKSGTFYVVNGKAIAAPEIEMAPDDMVFFKASTKGITRIVKCHLDFPNLPVGSFTYVHTEDDTPVDFKILSTENPSIDLSQKYGMQIFDATGDVAFDSRSEHFSIFQHIQISKVDQNDVLVNNAVKNYLISQSSPDCWISSPFFAPFRTSTDSSRWKGSMYFCKLEQTSSTNLRMSRVLRTRGSPSGTQQWRLFTQDAVIFLGRL